MDRLRPASLTRRTTTIRTLSILHCTLSCCSKVHSMCHLQCAPYLVISLYTYCVLAAAWVLVGSVGLLHLIHPLSVTCFQQTLSFLPFLKCPASFSRSFPRSRSNLISPPLPFSLLLAPSSAFFLHHTAHIECQVLADDFRHGRHTAPR
jgi:hypothetical protein